MHGTSIVKGTFFRIETILNNLNIWINIYQQQNNPMNDNNLTEFNFKVLHNILPCGYVLSKWNNAISEKCDVCYERETIKHVLYSCTIVMSIRNKISVASDLYIEWKHLVCRL